MTKAKKTAKSDKLIVNAPENDEQAQAKAIAANVLRPSITNAVTIKSFSKSFGDVDLMALVDGLVEQNKLVQGGDLMRAEATLTTQAHTLDAIFNNLAQRAALNMGEYINAAERYMRLALKAQSQCRQTLEALAMIKNPPIIYAKQANIANGPQQVNNGVEPTNACAPARAEKNQNQPNELLKAESYEQLDTRTPGTSGRVNSQLEAVETIDGAADNSR